MFIGKSGELRSLPVTGSASTKAAALGEFSSVEPAPLPLRRYFWQRHPSPLFAQPRPTSPSRIRQSEGIWSQAPTCYVMAPLQAVAAHYPDLVAQLVQGRGDEVWVYHYDPEPLSRGEPPGPAAGNFLPPASGSPLVTRLPRASWGTPQSPWYAYVERALGHRTCWGGFTEGYMDKSLHLLTGCGVDTGPLEHLPGRDELARRFAQGDCVVLYSRGHVCALRAVRQCPLGEHQYDVCNPRDGSRTSYTQRTLHEHFTFFAVTRATKSTVTNMMHHIALARRANALHLIVSE